MHEFKSKLFRGNGNNVYPLLKSCIVTMAFILQGKCEVCVGIEIEKHTFPKHHLSCKFYK